MASQAEGVMGGVREWSEIGFLLRHLDSLTPAEDMPYQVPPRDELMNRVYDFFGEYGADFEKLGDEDAERLAGEFIDGVLKVATPNDGNEGPATITLYEDSDDGEESLYSYIHDAILYHATGNDGAVTRDASELTQIVMDTIMSREATK